MQRQIQDLLEHFDSLQQKIVDPDLVMDQTRYKEVAKEFKRVEPIVELYRELESCQIGLNDTREILEDDETDDEMLEMAELEAEELQQKIEVLEQKLEIMLLPKDPLDERNIIVELRAGAGGDEAGLFVADLYRMYSRFAEKCGWKHEILTSSETGVGGFKELSFSITGELVYSKMKFESGVHRVQRVPATESSGRIHTSTITVAVLPEVEEMDFEINPSDVRVDTYCASGPGGQSVNTTYSAVRLTHEPTGTVVTCQDEKSQIKNKDKAFKVLRARLAEEERLRQQKEYAAQRSSQVGTGDRSEKIRTYNFPQGRVSDHRINLTLHQLGPILEGNMDEVIEALIAADHRAKLESLQQSPE